MNELLEWLNAFFKTVVDTFVSGFTKVAVYLLIAIIVVVIIIVMVLVIRAMIDRNRFKRRE